MEEVDKLTSRQVDESELHLVDLASGSWLLNLSTRSLVNLFTNKIAFNNKFSYVRLISSSLFSLYK
jgi:hypothetical protein